MNPQISASGPSLRRALTGSSFGTRLFLALTVVVVGCAVSAWLVASALAPGIFHDHLGQAGIDHNSSQAAHVEEAFAWSIVLAWGLAVAVAVLLALAVSWYITRRVQRSLTAVTTSTARIAGGRYDTRVSSPGLGREFDELAVTVNELARRLDATESTRRRMLTDLGHDVREVDPRYPDPTLAFVPQFFAGIRDEAAMVEHPERLERRTRETRRLGAWVTPRVRDWALRQTEEISGLANRVFDDVDVLLTPTVAHRPPRVGVIDGRGTVGSTLKAMPAIAYCALWNVAGNPAANVPAGLAEDGLPIGVQLVGRSNDETTLLSLSAQLEQARPWAFPRV